MTLFIKNSHSVLFLHVPKCGGSSIDSLFKQSGYFATLEMRGIPPQDYLVAPQHQTSEKLKSMINIKKINDTFILVRNPYDRILSEYNWQFKTTKPCEKPNINTWIIESLKRASADRSYSDNHFRACIDFIDIDLPCSIFKLEDGIEFIVEFFIRVQGSIDEIKIPTEKSAKNFTSHISRPKISSIAIDAINQFYKDDFKAFGYKVFGNQEATNSLESHDEKNNLKKEEKIRAIKRWREDTITILYKKSMQELNFFDRSCMKEKGDTIKRASREMKLSSNEVRQLSASFYDNILLKLKQSEFYLKSLSQSRQQINPSNIYNMINIINQQRGQARLIFSLLSEHSIIDE